MINHWEEGFKKWLLATHRMELSRFRLIANKQQEAIFAEYRQAQREADADKS